MTDFQSPGVGISEKRSSPVTFPSFSPSVGAFLGIAEKGPVNEPVRVYGIEDAQEVFGDFIPGSNLMDEVDAFFKNGGESCFISRIVHYTDPATPGTISALAATRMLSNGTGPTLLVSASSPGNFGNLLRVSTTRNSDNVAKVSGVVAAGSRTTLPVTSTLRIFIGDTISVLKVADTQRGIVIGIDPVTKIIQLAAAITVPVGGYDGTENVASETLTLQTVDKNGIVGVTYRNLRMSALAEKNYIENKINESARGAITVTVQTPPAGDARPSDAVNVLLGTTQAGTDGGTIVDADYVGSAAGKTGLYSFDNNEDFLLLSVPGVTTLTVVKGVETYVEQRQDIFSIQDLPQGLTPDQVVTFVRTTANLATSYMAVYFPWLRAPDYRTGGPSSFPPSGYVMGVFARTFARRNFGKAPAGVDDGRIYGVTGVDYEVQKSAYDTMYPNRINAVQIKKGHGICVMGSRTLDPNGDFIQINARIVFLVVKRVFKEGTQFCLFENNNRKTRARVVRFLTSYLRGLRQAEILDGETDQEAFFIQCDENNNTASVRKTGKLKARIGLNVGSTIEFVEMTLEQDTRAIDAELAAEIG
jgi:uncharacterized protein